MLYNHLTNAVVREYLNTHLKSWFPKYITNWNFLEFVLNFLWTTMFLELIRRRYFLASPSSDLDDGMHTWCYLLIWTFALLYTHSDFLTSQQPLQWRLTWYHRRGNSWPLSRPEVCWKSTHKTPSLSTMATAPPWLRGRSPLSSELRWDLNLLLSETFLSCTSLILRLRSSCRASPKPGLFWASFLENLYCSVSF